MRNALQVLALTGLGVAAGLAWNAFSGRGFPLGGNVLIAAGDDVISVEEAEERRRNGVLFLDARPRMNWEVEHVAGSLPLPEDEFDAEFAELEARLRGELSVVVYCSGYGCEASHIVARKLNARGIPAAILHDGWPAWQDAGYPTASALDDGAP